MKKLNNDKGLREFLRNFWKNDRIDIKEKVCINCEHYRPKSMRCYFENIKTSKSERETCSDFKELK